MVRRARTQERRPFRPGLRTASLDARVAVQHRTRAASPRHELSVQICRTALALAHPRSERLVQRRGAGARVCRLTTSSATLSTDGHVPGHRDRRGGAPLPVLVVLVSAAPVSTGTAKGPLAPRLLATRRHRPARREVGVLTVWTSGLHPSVEVESPELLTPDLAPICRYARPCAVEQDANSARQGGRRPAPRHRSPE